MQDFKTQNLDRNVVQVVDDEGFNIFIAIPHTQTTHENTRAVTDPGHLSLKETDEVVR